MTNEEKQLLLKDLCARLPYGVMINFSKDEDLKNLKIKSAKLLDILCENIENVYVSTESISYLNIKYVQPYLRPMSSMTEEEKLVWYSFMEKYQGFPDDTIHINKINDYQDWLNEHHFDYRGLIEKGLAIEASEGMYETEKRKN